MISKPSAIMILAFSSGFFLLMFSNLLAARKVKDHNGETIGTSTGGLDDFIISCVGDSITNGSSVNFSSSYPAILRRHFDRKSVEVYNFGSNGQTVLKISDHSYWLEEEYRRAMLTKANHVIIQFGTNDAKPPNWNEDLFRLDYTNLIERFQIMSSLPTVFICIPPPIYCPKRTNENEERNTCWKYNERSQITNNLLQHVISDISFKTGASLISNFKLLGGDKLLKPEAFFEPGKLKEEEWTNVAPYDGIHPNEHGNELMASNIAAKIVEHNHRSARLIRNYNHHKVIENDDQVHNSQVIASTSSIRSEVKHEAVYSHIYNHTLNDPNAEGSNPIMRPVIACVGDSLTQGVMSSNSNTMSYPAFLQRHPGFHHYQVLNFGCSGMCVMKGCGEGERDYRQKKQYATAMSSMPHIVIVQFGTNDVMAPSWDEKAFIADYCHLISEFKALSSQPTVYINIPTAVCFTHDDVAKSDEAEERSRVRRNEIILRVNVQLPPIIRRVATLTNSTVIDLFSAMGGALLQRTDAYDSGNVHLNDLGYLGVAHEVANTLALHEDFTFISQRGRVDRR